MQKNNQSICHYLHCNVGNLLLSKSFHQPLYFAASLFSYSILFYIIVTQDFRLPHIGGNIQQKMNILLQLTGMSIWKQEVAVVSLLLEEARLPVRIYYLMPEGTKVESFFKGIQILYWS